jgi:hypothetical protein
MLILENGSFQGAWGGGSLRTPGNMYSPIYYDWNDSGYYVDPNGTSNLNRITAATNQRLNIQWRGTPRSDITSDSDYWTNTQGWGTSYGTWANFWIYGAGFYDCWGSSTDHPQGSGYVHTQGLQSGVHYATASNGSAYGFQMVGAADQDSRWWLRGRWGGSTRPWYEIMMSNRNVGYTLYANIFYDSDNTGYYSDPNSTSNYNVFRSYSYQGNGNVGGTGSASWHPSGIYSAGYNWLYGGGNAGGNQWTNFSRVDANIFYDYNNTGYYVDPDSTSNVYRISGYQAPRYNTSDWADAFRNTPAFSRAFHGDISSGGPSGTWWFYDSMRHSNASNYWEHRLPMVGKIMPTTYINVTSLVTALAGGYDI